MQLSWWTRTAPPPKKGSLSPSFCHKDAHARKPVRNLHFTVKGKHKYRPLPSECQQARHRIPYEGILKAKKQSNSLLWMSSLSMSEFFSNSESCFRDHQVFGSDLCKPHFWSHTGTSDITYLYMPVHTLGSFSFLKDTTPLTFIYTVKLYANSCCFIGNTLWCDWQPTEFQEASLALSLYAQGTATTCFRAHYRTRIMPPKTGDAPLKSTLGPI